MVRSRSSRSVRAISWASEEDLHVMSSYVWARSVVREVGQGQHG
jgi:hypothetical protein